jgi:hypothetical protein
VLISLVAAVAVVVAEIPGRWWIAIAVTLIEVLFPGWVFVSTKYNLTDEELLVRSGPFRWHIPLVSITSIDRTRNPLSGPALSLDRLAVSYGDGRCILISPRELDEFLAEIKTRIAATRQASER